MRGRVVLWGALLLSLLPLVAVASGTSDVTIRGSISADAAGGFALDDVAVQVCESDNLFSGNDHFLGDTLALADGTFTWHRSDVNEQLGLTDPEIYIVGVLA